MPAPSAIAPLLPARPSTTSLGEALAELLAGGRALAPGRVLQAIVIARLGDSTAEISINGQKLIAETTLPISPGQRLSLELSSLGPPMRLRLLPEPGSGAPSLAAPQVATDPSLSLEASTLRLALPQQRALADAIGELARGLGSSRDAAEEPVSLRELLRALPTPRALSNPMELERAVLDSGLFLEAKLRGALSTPPPAAAFARDLKALLLRHAVVLAAHQDVGRTHHPLDDAPARPVASSLPAAPLAPSLELDRRWQTAGLAPRPKAVPGPRRGDSEVVPSMRESTRSVDPVESLKTVHSALARVQVNQLGSLPQGESPVVLQVELPVLVRGEIHPLSLRIEPGKTPKREADRTWSLMLRVELPQAGTLYAKLALSGTRLSATLWAEQESTRRELSDGLAVLRSYLDDAGLEVAGLRIGKLDGAEPPVQSPGPLLNVRA